MVEVKVLFEKDEPSVSWGACLQAISEFGDPSVRVQITSLDPEKRVVKSIGQSKLFPFLVSAGAAALTQQYESVNL